jgi:predicted permease
VRDRRRLEFWRVLRVLADLKSALRQLRKSPAFTTTAVLTLALGIGATTAIFTLVDGVLLKSLPVKDPAGLLRVGDNEQCCNNSGLPDFENQGKPNDWSLFSYEQYKEFRDHTPGFESLAAFQSSSVYMAVRQAGRNQPAQPTSTELVSGNAFPTLGIEAYAGRLLRPSDDVQGAPPVAVMSYATWEQRFGGERSVVGSDLLVNGHAVTVVGIAPPGFYGERLSAEPPSLWMPLNMLRLLEPESHELEHTETEFLNLIGRLAPGANVAAMQARMIVELQQFLESPLGKITLPEARALIPKQYLRLAPGGAGVQRMQDTYKDDLHLLMWVSSFVLLIACANLANLMLARSATRRQQIAVRTALGASRKRLVRGALVECLVLAMIGGLAGLVFAWGGARLILHLAFQHNPVNISASPSPVVLGFAFAVSLVTGLLFGVAPAWLAAHGDPIEALRGANRSTGRHETFAQRALVVAQAAVSVVLLCAAGFLILSMRQMERQHFGFDPTHRTIVQIDAQTAGYKPEQLQNFYRQVHETLSQIPGVISVAESLYSPMDGDNWGENAYVEGEPAPAPGSDSQGASWDRVSPGYFETIGTKLVQGRRFAESDDVHGRNVAVVNQTFVRKMLHGKNPIGMHFGDFDPTIAGTYEIVGVVEDAQYWDPNEPIRPMYFMPSEQWSELPATHPRAADYAHFIAQSHYLHAIEIETRGNVPELEERVREGLASVNPDLLVTRYQSFDQQVRLAFSQQHMVAELTSLFGALALVLAAIGLYGVTAYAVAQRTSEIGIRMALGADRLDVQRMVLRGAFWQVGIGLLIGIPAAMMAGHLMASVLYGVTVYEPTVLGPVVVVLMTAALLASSLPARRAAEVEPMEALRSQ